MDKEGASGDDYKMRTLKLLVLAPFAFAVACGGDKPTPPVVPPMGGDVDSGSTAMSDTMPAMDSGMSATTTTATTTTTPAMGGMTAMADAGSAMGSAAKDAGAKKGPKKPAPKK